MITTRHAPPSILITVTVRLKIRMRITTNICWLSKSHIPQHILFVIVGSDIVIDLALKVLRRLSLVVKEPAQ